MSDELTKTVKARYGAAARSAANGSNAGCCGPDDDAGCCGSSGECGADPITGNLYSAAEIATLPDLAIAASLGCGNPTALAELSPGQVVLDLGSGGGIDVLLSAKRVGPTGFSYGLDMTDEMLELARRNQATAGVTNVEFLRGSIDAIPLPDASVDVIISNCVINLAGDKRAVLAEAFRVLRSGGRFAVSDVLTRGTLPPTVRDSMPLWTGCVAGALSDEQFLGLLAENGFVDSSIEPTREYSAAQAHGLLADAGLDADVLAPQVDGLIYSGFVRARKP